MQLVLAGAMDCCGDKCSCAYRLAAARHARPKLQLRFQAAATNKLVNKDACLQHPGCANASWTNCADQLLLAYTHPAPAACLARPS